MMSKLRLILLAAAALWLVLPVASVVSQEPKNVTERLLEGLGEDTNASSRTPKAPNEAELANQAPSGARGWSKMAAEMRQIASEISSQAATENTVKAQAQLIEELQRLIAEAKSKEGSTSAAKGGTQTENSSGEQTDVASSEGAAGAPSGGKKGVGGTENAAAGNSAASATGAEGKSTGAGGAKSTFAPESLVRRAWGQLPGRIREKLQSATPEKFHSKYESETENYFRKLSELEQRP